MILETERLYLRKLTQNDFGSLCKILQDKDVMYAYEHAFSDEEVQEWLNRQLERYNQYGFGLWAVCLKENDEMIGQCGLTMQPCIDSEVLEIGYLFQKKYWHKGYATETAAACKKYAFEVLHADEVYSIIRDNNFASQRVAERNGMTVCASFTKHYYGMDMPHLVYSVKRNIELKAIKTKIEFWIWYEKNKPKTNELKEKDAFRQKNDLDCVLTNGNLKADTIFSLWLPFRSVLVELNGYNKLNKIGNINRKIEFLKNLQKTESLENLLPVNNPMVKKLEKLFYLGQTRSNVMILPERRLNTERAGKPYYDYMPYFLYECFDSGKFSYAFMNYKGGVNQWIKDQYLDVFFDGSIEKANIKDLSGSGSVFDNKSKDKSILLDNYINILEKRKRLTQYQ